MAVISEAVYSSMGLNSEEYRLIVELLGRDPNTTELGMFAVMWSEHCGYKYSRPVLAYFSKYKAALEGEGFENAGIVDIGDGLGITLKIESHNHPSAVEPYEGAATGVGGIIRDILTMGARPIASLNSLRFGPIVRGQADDAAVDRNRYLFEHVVAGIAGYGNCVGVPTIGGEVGFHPRYSGNPLVNALCVGVVRLDEVTTAAAAGVGNPVIYLGSATGKDGIHGATFASDALGQDSEAKRPNVQIGDPFAEKQLIEATLEALQTGAIVAIQDMGAAGLTCSTIEMASKGSVGMDVDLDLVPMRETDMTAYELMLSESQERMLAVATRGRESEVLEVFHKWGLKAVVIGTVTDDGITTIRRHGAIEARLPAKLLTDHCPTYRTEPTEPESFRAARDFNLDEIPDTDHEASLLRLLGSPELGSKRWVYRQFDRQVQTQTVLSSGEGDAAVLAIRGTQKGIALSIDGNSRQCALDPYVGAQLAVVEAARNVACTGALPTAVTDGLNFGNPQSGHVYWQFDRAVKGIADAASAMGTPVISGNVSFYNESDLGDVPPTPLLGMVGVIGNVADRLPLGPSSDSGLVALLSVPVSEQPAGGLGASAYLAIVHDIESGLPTPPNLAGEKALCETLVQGAAQRIVESAHDVSEGGFAVALAEIAIQCRISVRVRVEGTAVASGRLDASLFGEIPGRVIVCLAGEEALERLRSLCTRSGVTVEPLGTFQQGREAIVTVHGSDLRWDIHMLREAFESGVPKAMQSPVI